MMREFGKSFCKIGGQFYIHLLAIVVESHIKFEINNIRSVAVDKWLVKLTSYITTSHKGRCATSITGTSLNGGATTTYTYAGTGNANPHAVTTYGSTGYTYDNNGNVTAAGSSAFTYDYLNRITQSVVAGATTTYGYDVSGSRMYQTVGSTTTRYPSRLYSIASFTNGATTTATSTEYVFLRDMLIATIDQALVNGSATGTPTTSYIHPDHLNSTAVTTDANAAVTQALDYYPYGASRVSTGTSANKRQYIGEFSDGSGLSYLNARYYDSARGQFTSEDPVFWEIDLTRDGKNALTNPQSQNSYAYANDNPIVNNDPSGRVSLQDVWHGRAAFNDWQVDVGQGAMVLSQSNPAWSFALDHPYAAGALTGLFVGATAMPGMDLYAAARMATYPGVGSAFAAKQAVATGVYATLTYTTLSGLSGTLSDFNNTNFSNPGSYAPTIVSLAFNIGPNYIGGYVGSISDAYQFTNLLSQGLSRITTYSPRTAPTPTPAPVTRPAASLPGASSSNGGWGSARSACGKLCQ